MNDYVVRAYFDKYCRGFDDLIVRVNWDEAVEFAHRKLSDGDFVVIVNCQTGQSYRINPDEYFENFNGEFCYTEHDFE